MTLDTADTLTLPVAETFPKIQRLEAELREARSEIKNLLEMTAPITPKPGQIPQIGGVDIYGESLQLHGALGGDHVIFIDFKRRFDLQARMKRARDAGKESVAKQLELTGTKAGILVADVAGHSITDAALVGRLHDAFLACALYELDIYGTITPRLFETLNLRFYLSTSVDKLMTMIYGEVSESGMFRFISAAHPTPVVFSNEFNKFVDVSPDRFSIYPPLGTQPPEYHVDRKTLKKSSLGYKTKYQVNEINLMGSGDIMIVYTDGFSDHCNAAGEMFFSTLEPILQRVKHLSAAEISREIKQEMFAFAPAEDDITFVVIKKS
jgi:serine phosphatase RsbU (regulator of sigma subunit)